MKEAIKLVELYNGCHQASQAKGIEALKVQWIHIVTFNCGMHHLKEKIYDHSLSLQEYMSVRELKGIKLEDLSEQ